MSPTLIPVKRLPGLVKIPEELSSSASVIPLIFFLVKTVFALKLVPTNPVWSTDLTSLIP